MTMGWNQMVNFKLKGKDKTLTLRVCDFQIAVKNEDQEAPDYVCGKNDREAWRRKDVETKWELSYIYFANEEDHFDEMNYPASKEDYKEFCDLQLLSPASINIRMGENFFWDNRFNEHINIFESIESSWHPKQINIELTKEVVEREDHWSDVYRITLQGTGLVTADTLDKGFQPYSKAEQIDWSDYQVKKPVYRFGVAAVSADQEGMKCHHLCLYEDYISQADFSALAKELNESEEFGIVGRIDKDIKLVTLSGEALDFFKEHAGMTITKKDIDIARCQRQLAAIANDPNAAFTTGPHVHFEWDNEGNFIHPVTKEIIHPATKESKELVDNIRKEKQEDE